MLVVSNGDRVTFQVTFSDGAQKWVEVEFLIEKYTPLLVQFFAQQRRVLKRFGRKFPVLEDVRERFAVRVVCFNMARYH
jgi:hypothetical protein